MSPIRSQQSLRISSLLVERRVSGVVMVLILATALFCGIVGFAFHLFWVFAIVVLALGLGYVVANARQNRVEGATRSEDTG